jgi:alanyl-tRNA synthetase
LLEELADFQAAQLLAETASANGRKIVSRIFPDRDLAYIRLLAQRLTRKEANVAVMLATTSEPVSLVFAQSKGMPFDMSALLKETVGKLGGRGGGSKDMAQGGAATAHGVEAALEVLAQKLRGEMR